MPTHLRTYARTHVQVPMTYLDTPLSADEAGGGRKGVEDVGAEAARRLASGARRRKGRRDAQRAFEAQHSQEARCALRTASRGCNLS